MCFLELLLPLLPDELEPALALVFAFTFAFDLIAVLDAVAT